MEIGEVLVDSESGLKLLVVEKGNTGRMGPVTVDGRPLQVEATAAAGTVTDGMELSTDPGDRG